MDGWMDGCVVFLSSRVTKKFRQSDRSMGVWCLVCKQHDAHTHTHPFYYLTASLITSGQ